MVKIADNLTVIALTMAVSLILEPKKYAMKTLILSALLWFPALYGFAQKVIENPAFQATTSNNVVITRIDLQDTCTILHFKVTFPAGQSINLPKESFIQPAEGGDKLIVTRAEGAELVKPIIIDESGELSYRLFFPKLDPSVTMIDFGEGGNPTGTAWFIYNIELVPSKHVPLFPETIEGDWFLTDGGHQWKYSFHDQTVIYNGEVYFQVGLTTDGEVYKLTLEKNGKQQILDVIPAPANCLFVSADQGKTDIVSRQVVFRMDTVFLDDQEFALPVFKKDTAVYKGYLKGYTSKLGVEGKVIVMNVLASGQDTYPIPIARDGTFEVKIPVNYPQTVTVQFFNQPTDVFLEPGKTIFQYLNQFAAAQPAQSRTSLFMGDGARANEGMQATSKFLFSDYNALMKNVVTMTYAGYRDWLMEVQKGLLDSLNRYSESHPVSKKTLQIRRLGIPFQVYQQILTYPMYKSYMSRDTSKVPPTPEKPVAGFYSCISADDLNNPLSVVTGMDYAGLIGNIQYLEFMRPKMDNFYRSIGDSLKRHGIVISAGEQAMLEKLSNQSSPEKDEQPGEDVLEAWNTFSQKHTELISSLYTSYYLDELTRNLKQYFNLDPGLFTDILFSQMKIGSLKNRMVPFSREEENSIKRTVHTSFIADYLLATSKMEKKKLEAKIKENKGKKGYFINKIPSVPVDSLFEAITGRYKGKVVFVDFWATWCGPCKEGIARMKPLKEEYKGKDLVFVYLTDPSSPEKTFNLMVPDIKGQHYRLTKEQSKPLYKRFNVQYIPRYMLVDKSGKLISEDLGDKAQSNEELRKLFDECLK
jgi:thiol-disulfide isomerase/thioredoxin